jgi:hypothetical protein
MLHCVTQKTSQNAQDVEQLAERIHDLTAILQKCKSEGTIAPVILGRIDRLSKYAASCHTMCRLDLRFRSTWNIAADDVRKMNSRPSIKRVFNYSDDAQSISGHVRKLSWSIQNFTVCLLCIFPPPLSLHLKQVETLLDMEFALDVSQSSGCLMNAELKYYQDHIHFMKHAATRIERKIDNIKDGMQVYMCCTSGFGCGLMIIPANEHKVGREW